MMMEDMNMYMPMPMDFVQMSCLYDVVPVCYIQRVYELNDIHDFFVLVSFVRCVSHTVQRLYATLDGAHTCGEKFCSITEREREREDGQTSNDKKLAHK